MKRIIFLIISALFFSNIFPQNEVCFDIEPNSNTNPGFDYFTKYINVLDSIQFYTVVR